MNPFYHRGPFSRRTWQTALMVWALLLTCCTFLHLWPVRYFTLLVLFVLPLVEGVFLLAEFVWRMHGYFVLGRVYTWRSPEVEALLTAIVSHGACPAGSWVVSVGPTDKIVRLSRFPLKAPSGKRYANATRLVLPDTDAVVVVYPADIRRSDSYVYTSLWGDGSIIASDWVAACRAVDERISAHVVNWPADVPLFLEA